MRGDAVVAQWIFVLAMLIAPVGLIWVVVLYILLDLLHDDRPPYAKRKGLASYKQPDGFESHIAQTGIHPSRPDKGT